MQPKLILSLLLIIFLTSCEKNIFTSRHDAIQYLIVNNSTDDVNIYFKHSFPEELYKENLFIIKANTSEVCAQFTDQYVHDYFSNFTCGMYAESLLIWKIHVPDTVQTKIMQDNLWQSGFYSTKDYNTKTCTYIISDLDF